MSAIGGALRELLVRYLDAWTPGALHGARGATFAYGWSTTPDGATAEAALRVFAEFADRLRGRRLAVVLVGPAPGALAARMDAVQAELGTPPELSVHTVEGPLDERLPVALKAAGAAGAPLLAFLDGAGPASLAAAGSGRPAEVLLVSGTGEAPAPPMPLTARVDLVSGSDGARLVTFATTAGKGLEAFKNALWAVDEYAGVRYRDPRDPEGHLLDISLSPHPGPLRREILAHLRAAGPRTVTELRQFTLTQTVYRASDTVRVLNALLGAGAVTRTPERGRLGGDVVIAVG
ncbi:helix-turn-helix transcriptional regulator [Phytohabitans suffuscus]|uniref:Uncharacterized protein n=1 Tax=Phytohabitans suffuscus TaxID=624315 RepID=A0A6F8YPN7_9ACTN|nr:helix-turn-helix transcriptional regulator [Phytohabitans suffuscus]BCB88090.1 hypothetical protein Psuf_054030 [Phytohabitans suffuscus]